MFFHPNRLTFLGHELYGWVQYFGFYICVLLPQSYLIVFLLGPLFFFVCFYITVLCWWTVGFSGKLLLCLGLWFIVCILIVKCHLKLKLHTHSHTQTLMCVPHKSTQLVAEIFLYSKSKPRCRFNVRNMYYCKTTRLVKRTAEYKTSSTINVFTYTAPVFLHFVIFKCIYHIISPVCSCISSRNMKQYSRLIWRIHSQHKLHF